MSERKEGARAFEISSDARTVARIQAVFRAAKPQFEAVLTEILDRGHSPHAYALVVNEADLGTVGFCRRDELESSLPGFNVRELDHMTAPDGGDWMPLLTILGDEIVASPLPLPPLTVGAVS